MKRRILIAVSVLVAALAVAGGAYAATHQSKPVQTQERALQPSDPGYFAPGFAADGSYVGR